MSELRRSPLTKRWVLCGSEYGIRQIKSFYYDEQINENINNENHTTHKTCPLCEGNEYMTPPEIYAIRNNEPNKPGWKVRVVPHRFPIFKIEGELGMEGFGLYDKMNPIGAHEVIIENARHSDRISNEQVASVYKTIKNRVSDLSKDSRFKYIMIYKNRGKAAGAILSHPHSNIIALPFIPNEIANKLHTALQHYDTKSRCLYCDLIRQELKQDERIVYSNKDFLAIVPYAARFPFEVMVLPLKHNWNYIYVTDQEINSLADMINVIEYKLEKALSTCNRRYMLFNGPIKFAKKGYWSSLEQDFHWHMMILPVITKSIGVEWGSDFYVNPILPEEAAEYLREI